jgi:hypothetical protein
MRTEEKAASPAEDHAATRARLRRIVKPRWLLPRVVLFKAAKVLLGALLTAVLLELVLPPELPAASKGSSIELGPQIGLDLETALLERRGTRLNYSQADVNSYLATVLKRKAASLEKPLLHFEGAQVVFGEGLFHVNAARSLFGYSLYTGIAYRVTLRQGKIEADVKAGNLGRMPVHPELMKYGAKMFNDIWEAVAQDRKQVANMASLEFHPDLVVLTAPSPTDVSGPATTAAAR